MFFIILTHDLERSQMLDLVSLVTIAQIISFYISKINA